jgi:prepilin-type N-terminal cleavage/methylation domain-containing protein
MDNNLAIKKGFALLELTIVLAIAGVLLVTIISNYTNFMNRAKFQATVKEMGSIAEAAVDYYNSSNNPNDSLNPQPLTWPADVSILGNPYMPQAVILNPFGGSYKLAFANNMVTVSTTIPKGVLIDPNEGIFLNVTAVATGQKINITQSIPNEYSGRLDYDLHYLYKK